MEPGSVDPAGVDLNRAGVEAESVTRQYADGRNLARRVGLYRFLVPATPLATTFEAWVLDHHDWPERATAIDIGCGTGTYLPELASRAPTVVAADLSSGMVREALARDAGRRPVGVVADAQRLPLRDARVDVALAAHMLYHVPDIPAALVEIRRVLRPGAAFIAVLNGARDKAEILEVWRRAAQVVAPALRLPAWGSRCNLDNVVSFLRHAFDEVSPPDRLPGVFRFPTAEPPLAWIDSLRAGTEHLVSDRTWQDLLGEARRLIDDHIKRTGIFEVHKESGVVVAKAGYHRR